MNTDIKPLLISTYDIVGGAAHATNRLHKSLNARNIKSSMQVTRKESDDWRINGLKGYAPKLKKLLYNAIEEQCIKFQKSNNSILHSSATLSILNAKQLNASVSDVIHLNWICHNSLSIEEIARISKPVVWTLHDMWAFCGAEHVSSDMKHARWREGYTKTNRDINHKGLDIDRWVWKRKKKAWKNPFHIVVPSQWLAKCVIESALMHDWPVTVIPNVLDTEVFKPIEKNTARKILGLPLHTNLILFGAIGGTRDYNKGWDLLHNSLNKIPYKEMNTQGVIFGQSQPKEETQLEFPLTWMGHVNDYYTLTLLYSASDVMVVPSRIEAFGQTASEAQACGCPVVAFNTSGLMDVIGHKKTGYLAEPYSSEDLSAGIQWVLESSSRYKNLSQAARERAVELWSPEVVVPKYLDVYEKAIESHHSSKKT